MRYQDVWNNIFGTPIINELNPFLTKLQSY
jgi:hypothetical protein